MVAKVMLCWDYIYPVRIITQAKLAWRHKPLVPAFRRQRWMDLYQIQH